MDKENRLHRHLLEERKSFFTLENGVFRRSKIGWNGPTDEPTDTTS